MTVDAFYILGVWEESFCAKKSVICVGVCKGLGAFSVW